MNKSQDLSDSRDVTRTTPQPTILCHSTPLTHTTPDHAYGVIMVNRSQRSPRRGHGSGNEPALNSAVPSTSGLQPHIYRPQTAVWQQHSTSIDKSVQRGNKDNRQCSPVLLKGGLAEQRHDRSPPAVGPNTEPTPSRVLEFVMEGNPNSAQPSKPVQTDVEKRKVQQHRQQLKRKGGACMRCCIDKKGCDIKDICERCSLQGIYCFRNIEQLWLYNATVQRSLDPGSKEPALREARSETFAESTIGQDFPGCRAFLAIYLTSKLGDSTATSPIVLPVGSLAENLQSMPGDLTKKFKTALKAHVQDLILPSLPSVLTAAERSLMASAQSAFRVYNFLSNASHVNYHASPRHMNLATKVSRFLVEYCARLLATEVEEVLRKISPMIRQRYPNDVPKHAFGLYYGILAGLQQWNTQSALDVVLKPLILKARVVIPGLCLLYRNVYEGTETLQQFANRAIPAKPEIHKLHLSHDLTAIDHSITSWNLTLDPFHKDFSVDLRGLLVRDGKVNWVQELHPVQRGVSSPELVDAVDNSALQRGRPEASELRSSQPLYESPDETLRNSFWDDRSTYIQSPTEAEHVAELGRGNQVQVGDVKTPQDLLCITGGSTGPNLKRRRSVESRQCTSPSPPPKRSELDAGQACLGHPEHQLDDAAFMMEASETSGPSSLEPEWELFIEFA